MSTFPFNSFYYCCCLRENRRTWRQKAKMILFICYCKQRSEEGIWKLNTQFCLDLESLLLNSSDSRLSGQFTAGPWGVPKRSSSLYSLLFLWRAFTVRFPTLLSPNFVTMSIFWLSPAWQWNPFIDSGHAYSQWKRRKCVSSGSSKR